MSHKSITGNVDNLLRQSGPLKRYGSLSEAGLQISDFHIPQNAQAEIDKWKGKFKSVLDSAFKKPKEIRSSEGWRFDLDEALSGESDCFRRFAYVKPSPIKIGINVSAAAGTFELNTMRGGAVMALTELLRKTRRPFTAEVTYGNGLNAPKTCHIRVTLPTIGDAINYVALGSNSTAVLGVNLVSPLATSIGSHWRGVYRIHEFESRGIHEFDFCLDRIESSDVGLEFKRIEDRLRKLGLTDGQKQK